jgi:hypothetical protein
MKVCVYSPYFILPEGQAERCDVSVILALQAVCVENA